MTPNTNTLNKHRVWFVFFLVVGLLGVLDISSRAPLHSPDAGIISLAFSYLSIKAFSSTIAAPLIGIVNILLGFSIIWLVIAAVEWRKIKKIRQQLHNAPTPPPNNL